MMLIRTCGMVSASLILACTAITPAWSSERERIANGKSWTLQLDGDARSIRKRNADVAVVDPDEVRNPGSLKKKASGERRSVLAYISVGEAETYRGYMKKGSKRWLTSREQGWAGNKIVKYWDPEWKKIVKSRVRAAIDAGYDGVYLDRVDTYENIKAPKGSSRSEMVKLVKEVAREARSRKHDAAVAVQNAEELLDDRDYLSTIDAVGKEDLYHGIRHDGRSNSKESVRYSESMLRKAKASGKGVYVLEYVNGEAAKSVRSKAKRAGFAISTGRRDLTTASED